MQPLAGHHLPFAAGGREHHAGVGLGRQDDAAEAVVAPGVRHVELAPAVIAIDQRRAEIATLELEFEARVDRTNPEPVLLCGGVPLPLDLVRPDAATVVEAHEVGGGRPGECAFQPDVLDRDGLFGDQRAMQLHKAVELDQAGDLQGEGEGVLGSGPLDDAGFFPQELHLAGSEFLRARGGFHHQLQRLGEHLGGLLADARVAAVEKRP